MLIVSVLAMVIKVKVNFVISTMDKFAKRRNDEAQGPQKKVDIVHFNTLNSANTKTTIQIQGNM